VKPDRPDGPRGDDGSLLTQRAVAQTIVTRVGTLSRSSQRNQPQLKADIAGFYPAAAGPARACVWWTWAMGASRPVPSRRVRPG
jgi:hypothetical protein